ncbi:MAG: histidine--tRNA ligase [Thermoplasmata archaeon]|nr:histidine--tRNA ligase [Thermoplasmata archaeon]MCI4361961.1 histidine--tRNA ligase [Thermoplasmata archaeon]
MPFETLRGFRDYPPPDGGARSEIFRRMRAAARRSGFQELETPSVESLELFQAKSGEEIGQQVWAFRDKGDRPVALLAETTPSLARIFVDRAKAEPLPVKWFTHSKLWRYEEPQSGRTREFSQFNLDILGVPGVEAEVELLQTAAALMDDAGATGLYAFRLNDRALAEGIGRRFGVQDGGRYFRAVDRSRKTSGGEFADALAGAGVTPEGIDFLRAHLEKAGDGVPAGSMGPILDELAGLGLGEAADAGVARLRDTFALLGTVGVADRTVYDPTVVRGLEYYTSSVFEAFDKEGDLRSLFGGGRYDHLVELFGGPPTPACGLAIGDQTLELLLRANGRWPEGEPPLDTYVVATGPEVRSVVLELVAKLRRAGVSADFDPMRRSLSRQLREASRRRARRAWIVGPQELARGQIVERDLATGTQTEIPRDGPVGPA